MAHRSEEAVGEEPHSRPRPGRQGAPARDASSGVSETPLWGSRRVGSPRGRQAGRALEVWQDWSDRGGDRRAGGNHQSRLNTTHETCWEALQELGRSWLALPGMAGPWLSSALPPKAS